MKPQSVLSEKDYHKIVQELQSCPSIEDYLAGCIEQYLPINQNFFPVLIRTIDNYINQSMSFASDMLKTNPHLTFESANQSNGNLQNLKALLLKVEKCRDQWLINSNLDTEVYLSFEDWENERFDLSLMNGQFGENIMSHSKGFMVKHTLSENDFNQIIKFKKETFKACVERDLAFYKDRLEDWSYYI